MFIFAVSHCFIEEGIGVYLCRISLFYLRGYWCLSLPYLIVYLRGYWCLSLPYLIVYLRGYWCLSLPYLIVYLRGYWCLSLPYLIVLLKRVLVFFFAVSDCFIEEGIGVYLCRISLFY